MATKQTETSAQDATPEKTDAEKKSTKKKATKSTRKTTKAARSSSKTTAPPTATAPIATPNVSLEATPEANAKLAASNLGSDLSLPLLNQEISSTSDGLLADVSAEKSTAKTAATATTATTTVKTAHKATAAQKEQARKARAGARIAKSSTQKAQQAIAAFAQPPADASAISNTASANAAPNPRDGEPIRALADGCTTENVWTPSAAIPSLDQATYESHKTLAAGQQRALEIARINLKNMNELRQLESQEVEVAISRKATETQYAKLEGEALTHQMQVEINGERSQQLEQAVAKRATAVRETEYTKQLLSLKEQNFELEVQQAQNIFSEKAARYRAQLSGQ